MRERIGRELVAKAGGLGQRKEGRDMLSGKRERGGGGGGVSVI